MASELALAGRTDVHGRRAATSNVSKSNVSKRGVGRPRGSTGEARRPLIVSAAVHVFAHRGYDAATLQEVADLVDITRPAVHHYFPGKAPLFRAALDRAYEIVMPTLAADDPEAGVVLPPGETRVASALLGASLAQSNRIADIAPRITGIADDLRGLCAKAHGPNSTDVLLAVIVGRWVLAAATLPQVDAEAEFQRC